jgi:hypothetical protein
MEKTLYKKLAYIQSSIRGLGQDKRGNNYQYVSGSKVLSAIKPLMIEQGLLLKQEIVEIRNERQDYLVGREQKPKSEMLTTLIIKFTWVDVETGEIDENLFAANGQNDWDKGVGSALTYAERYFLLKYFHIATDEDDCDAPKERDLLEDVEIFPPVLEAEILTATSIDQLTAIYKRESSNFKDASTLIELCGRRKQELSK